MVYILAQHTGINTKKQKLRRIKYINHKNINDSKIPKNVC